MDLEHILRELSQERPIFHSEADFQHALAWQIHTAHPSCKVRLERRSLAPDNVAYIDICAFSDTAAWPVEVKYKTKTLRVHIAGESFDLKNQDAEDQARYDFLKDLQRLETETHDRANTVGHAVFLTNNALYWRPAKNDSVVDLAFRIHEGTSVSGTMRWADHARAGTMSGRESPVKLRNTYRLSWTNYSRPDDGPDGQFRKLVVRVPPP